MSLTCFRAIGCSILFYFIFSQALKIYQIVAMMLCTMSVVTIVISADNTNNSAEKESDKFYVVLACTLVILAVAFQCIRDAVLKYFFGTAKEVNISALFNFAILLFDITFVSYLLFSITQGFEFPLTDFLAGSLSGLMLGLANYLISYVYVRGIAGVANTIIETKIIYQTMFDLLIFGRYPNITQYFGLII